MVVVLELNYGTLFSAVYMFTYFGNRAFFEFRYDWLRPISSNNLIGFTFYLLSSDGKT